MLTVLITGASSGIGHALVKEFAKEEYHLILVGRNQQKLITLMEKLNQVTPTSFEIVELDLSNLDDVRRLSRSFKIDCLVNCAGVGEVGDVQTLSLEQEEREIQVNFLAPMILSKLFAQQFLIKNTGMIINICSTSVFYTHPFMTTYSASKVGLFHYTLGLSEELRQKAPDIKVVTVCPGPTKTTFFDEKMSTDFQQNWGATLFQMTPDNVARQIMKARDSKKSYQIIGYRNWWLTKSIQLLPVKLRLRVIGNYLRKGVLS